MGEFFPFDYAIFRGTAGRLNGTRQRECCNGVRDGSSGLLWANGRGVQPPTGRCCGVSVGGPARHLGRGRN